MALINTLRNKMGKFLVAVVALAIISFILADFLGQGSGMFNNDREVGEIAGKEIMLDEFQAEIQEVENQFMLSTNRQPTEDDMVFIREAAWESLINKYAIEKQYDKLGIMVSDDEMWDMVQGKNIDQGIRQSFTNPETGVFDRQAFVNFLQTLPQRSPEEQIRWNLFKQNLKPARERLKYENLILSAGYVTTAEAQREYNAQNNIADITYLYIPFYVIPDSAVNVTDSQLEDYYEENKESYKTEATKSIKYVMFPILPTAEDSAMVMDEMKDILEDIRSAENDSLFASALSDGEDFYNTYRPGTLPPSVQAVIDTMETGEIAGPFLQDGKYKIVKLTKVSKDTVDYARASHILFKWTEDTPEAKKAAREEAMKVLKEIKDGANFSAMARQYGQDATKNRGGDLGWFQTGDMVEEFEKAIFGAKEEGLLDNLVETEYGYHIIKVDDVKQNTLYTVASIEREIIPGTETENEAYRNADVFAAEVSNSKEFEDYALEKQLTINSIESIKKNDRRIGRLGEAREIVQWLFRDASLGDVSEVFEIDGAYVIATVANEVEEGYKALADVKAEVAAKVKNQLKGQQIINKLEGSTGTIDEIAANFGEEANVYNMTDLNLSSNSLTGVGYDPKAVGIAFSLDNGERSAPFAGENGVLIIEMNNKTEAPEIADYETYKQQIRQRTMSRAASNITEAIKKNADIEDNRYKFY